MPAANPYRKPAPASARARTSAARPLRFSEARWSWGRRLEANGSEDECTGRRADVEERGSTVEPRALRRPGESMVPVPGRSVVDSLAPA